jgi:uncharacterized membrane protein
MTTRRRPAKRRDEIEWDFFSFPTVAGFFAGMFLTVLLLPVVPLVGLVALLGFSYCLAHISTHLFLRRRNQRRREREEEDERERRALAARAALATEASDPQRRRRRRRHA